MFLSVYLFVLRRGLTLYTRLTWNSEVSLVRNSSPEKEESHHVQLTSVEMSLSETASLVTHNKSKYVSLLHGCLPTIYARSRIRLVESPLMGRSRGTEVSGKPANMYPHPSSVTFHGQRISKEN